MDNLSIKIKALLIILQFLLITVQISAYIYISRAEKSNVGKFTDDESYVSIERLNRLTAFIRFIPIIVVPISVLVLIL